MTYCLGIVTRHGLVMAADSRTNAGVDYISTYQKLFDYEITKANIRSYVSYYLKIEEQTPSMLLDTHF